MSFGHLRADEGKKSPREFGALRVALALAVIIAAAPVAPPALAQDQPASAAEPAKHKSAQELKVSDAWRQGTGVVPGGNDTNPQCEPLKRTMKERIATIGQLRKQIDKTKTVPPKTVVGTLQQWMGEPYVSSAESKFQRKLTEASASAKELNEMLAAASCDRVDVEAEVAKANALDDLQAPVAVTPQPLDKDNRTIFDDPAPR